MHDLLGCSRWRSSSSSSPWSLRCCGDSEIGSHLTSMDD
jgi:hypothetical protein